MGLFKHKFTNILKCLDKHKSMRMNHSHFSIYIIRQFAATLDKSSIKIGVALVGALVVFLYKLFQLLTKVCTVCIGRIGNHHIVLLRNYFKERDGIVGLCQCICIATSFTQFVHLVPQLLHKLEFKGKHIFRFLLYK